MRWKIMSPMGWCGPVYLAKDADTAIILAKLDGYDVIDVMDDVLVVADEGDFA